MDLKAKKFDSIFLLISIFIILLGSYGNNFLEGIAAGFSFFIIYRLLWKDNEPPVLFFAVTLQWTQIAIRVFDTSFLRIPFASVYENKHFILNAYYGSLFGIITLSFGIYKSRQNAYVPTMDEWREMLSKIDFERFKYVFFLSIPVSTLVFLIGSSIGGLQLFSTKLALLSWALFFVFYLLSNELKKGNSIFIITLLIQFILSFTGFFSNFKDFFISVAICYVFLLKKLKFSQLLVFGIFASIAILFGIYWQTVKGDYRDYISGGQTTQSRSVSQKEALNKLVELLSAVDEQKFADGRERFLERLSYIDLLSAAMDYVPAGIPYEKGKLIGEAFLKILMPRFLFPNKEIIDDSKKTAKYTGLYITGADKGTSISLGYFAECYIDFGILGMNFSLLLIGLIVGYLYQKIIDMVSIKLWGYAIAFCTFPAFYLFETDLDKVLPDQVAFFLVIWLLNRYYLSKFFDFIHT